VPFKVVSLLVLLLATACGSRVDEVPGKLESGSIEEVTARAAGGGGQAERIGGQIGVVPFTGQPPKAIPVIKPAEIVSFWVFPRKSRDGMAYRHGFYIDAVIRPFSWGMDEVMRNDRLRLSSLSNLRIGKDGALLIDAGPEPDPRVVDSIRGMAAGGLPWREGEEETQRTTTTIVFDDGRGAVRSTAPTAAAPDFVNQQGGVNLAEVEQAIREADRRIREAQDRRPAALPPAQP
jgi:hypothetical protein